MTSKRVEPSETVRRAVLMESGYFCANPVCHAMLFELHHITYVSEGGGNEASNLLALCPNCHTRHHKGDIPIDAIRAWKGMLVYLNHAIVHRESIDLLLFLYMTQNQPPILPPGDTLKFARLLWAGLADADVLPVGDGAAVASSGNTVVNAFPYSFNVVATRRRYEYEVKLSNRGRLLMDAWLNGDDAALQRAIVAPIRGANDEETVPSRSSEPDEN